MELEKVIDEKIKPLLDRAMHQYLGIKIDELKTDITDKLKKNPVLDVDIDTSVSFKSAKKNFKRHYFAHILHSTLGNLTEAARIAGIDRRSFHRVLVNLQLDPEKFRKELTKGEYIKQLQVEDLIHSSLNPYRSVLHPKKFRQMYAHSKDLSMDIARSLPAVSYTYKEAEKIFEKRYQQKALNENNKNISKTARKIGLRFASLHRKLRSLNLI